MRRFEFSLRFVCPAFCWLLVVSLVAFLALPLGSQSTYGTILGSVRDSSGALVAGAEVRVTAEEGSDGEWRASRVEVLKTGIYRQ